MKTASYFTYFGPGRVGISIGTPRKVGGTIPTYRSLAPRRSMLQLPLIPYREIYFGEILSRLDPHQVVDELIELAGGSEPVLLCFERPPFTEENFCHRRMVAEWLANTVGLDVSELD